GEYFRQDGMMRYIHDYLDRYNLRGNATYKLTKWWDAGANFTFTRQSYQRPSIFNDPNMNAEPSWNFYRITQQYPIMPIYNPEGAFTDDWMSSFINGGDDVTKTNETTASFNTTFKLYKDIWTVKADATYRFTGLRHTRTDIANPPAYRGPGQAQPAGASRGAMSDDQRKYIVYNAYTNYNQTFGGKHEVGAMAGFNQEYYESDRFEVSVTDLLSTTLPSINLTKPSSSTNKSQSIDTWALRGAFGRLNYIFDNRYLLELSGRYDGTSRFPKDSRFVFNPSGSVGWTLSNERFMQSLNETLRISNLKFRASYGSLGNQVVGSYDYISTMSFSSKTTVLIDVLQPAKITQPGADNSSLTWETVRTVNLALDLGLLENRLDLTFDKYTRYTDGMLTKSKTLPGIFGADPPQTNAANLKTDGWELTLGWRDRVKNVLGSPLSYSARFMLWDYTGYITKYDNPTKVLSDRYEGEEMGQIWGYETLGYFSSDEEAAAWADQSALGNGRAFKAGDLKFRDRNNDGLVNNGSNTVDNPGDMKVIGNNTPHFFYSFDLGADWKGFDLRVFLHGIGKREMYAPGGADGYAFWGMYTSPWRSLSEMTLDNWDYKGDAGFYPRMKADIAGGGELSQKQTKYLQDASFMRLKNVTLGYTLPTVLTNKWKIDRLRLYVSGENLLTFHHIQVPGNDPERFDQAFHPFTKVFSVGLNLTF
ncbi:MAG: SusC/RagA family TonB-linked outer membrane protein, partial [Tannerellaceae bacterium]|nr:SusC/RagA family TonB-linked outer membrane protein [Tannerellaceae bacterium]